MNSARKQVAVVVGAVSKWQADGRNTKLAHGKVLDDRDVPVGIRWGVGGAIAQKRTPSPTSRSWTSWLDSLVLFNPLQCLLCRPVRRVPSKEGADGLNTSLTSSTSPRDPGTDQTEQHTRDDHGDREPNEGESQTLQIGHWTVPPCVIEACRSAIHAALCTACHGVRSHPVPIAPVGKCCVPVV